MGRKRKTADISAQSFRHRLALLCKAKNKSIKQLHEEGGVVPRHTRDIIARGSNPTFRLIQRLVEPQGLSVACFVGDIKTLVITLRKEKENDSQIMGNDLQSTGRTI